MTRFVFCLTAVAFWLGSPAVQAQSLTPDGTQAMVSPALVPEGDFAVKLAATLGLGTAADASAAQDALTAAGIAPKNGWIASYPVTPDVLAELQESVSTAAENGKLSIPKPQALESVRLTTGAVGIAITPAAAVPTIALDHPNDKQNAPAPNPTVIDDYYMRNGPPVVTYVTPPGSFASQYVWTPIGFYAGGIYFPGFFVLHDFHRNVEAQGRQTLISNHVLDAASGAARVVDPAARTSAQWNAGSAGAAAGAAAIPSPPHESGPAHETAGARPAAEHIGEGGHTGEGGHMGEGGHIGEGGHAGGGNVGAGAGAGGAGAPGGGGHAGAGGNPGGAGHAGAGGGGGGGSHGGGAGEHGGAGHSAPGGNPGGAGHAGTGGNPGGAGEHGHHY